MDFALNLHPLVVVFLISAFVALRITRIEIRSLSRKKKTKTPF
jgi:hypothetical protein